MATIIIQKFVKSSHIFKSSKKLNKNPINLDNALTAVEFIKEINSAARVSTNKYTNSVAGTGPLSGLPGITSYRQILIQYHSIL